MTGDIVVELAGGVYSLSRPLLLDIRDSGSGGFKMIYRAATGEIPVFRGGVSISGWTAYDSSANVYRASVTETGFRQIYVNGVLAIRAREPNLENPDNFGPYLSDGFSVDMSTNALSIPATAVPPSLSNLKDLEVVFLPHWYHNRIRVETMSIDGATVTVTPQEPERSNIFNKNGAFYENASFYFENAYELLDAENEWYFDSMTSTLYYKPKDGDEISDVEIIVPVTESLLVIEGTPENRAHDIEVRGITFEATSWEYPSRNGAGLTQGNQIIEHESLSYKTPPGAIEIGNAYNIRLERNTFRNIGGSGINIRNGTTDSQIVGNNLSEIMSNGVVLASAATKNPSPAEQVRNVTISNNVITKVGRQYTNAQAIFAGFVKDIMIEHNEIRNFGYSGIQVGQQSRANIDVGMSNNIVQHNHIHSVMKVHDDGGGIYTLARQPGTHIFENSVHDIHRGEWASIWPVAGIYRDGYSEFITVERNVLENNPVNIYEQTGAGAQNNTFISNNNQEQAVKQHASLEPAYRDIDNN
jgi:hypothetical protein